MSLRAFHVFFILVSIALTVWLGFSFARPWLIASAALLVYLVWFIRKSGSFGKS